MMRSLWLFALFAALLFGEDFPQSEPLPKKPLYKVSVQLHWKYQFEYAGFIAAKEKGFYKDAGLDVTFKEFEYGTDIKQDVLSGKSTFGIYNSSILVDYLQGSPLKLVSSFFKRSALILIVKPSIKSPKDLVGKKILAATRKDFDLNFKPYLKGYGVDSKDIELLPHTYSIKEFVKGEVDGMTAFISYQPYLLDDKWIQYNILDPSDDNLYILQMELFTSQKVIDENPKMVEKFRIATIKGWRYALTHKQEIAKLIHQKYAPNISVTNLLREAKGIEKLILPYTYVIGSVDKNFLNKQMEFFINEYKISKKQRQGRRLENFIFDYEKEISDIEFNKRERGYIEKHKDINVCIQYDQFPFDGIDQKGNITGILGDVFEDISDMTSLRFHPVFSNSVEQMRENIKAKKCELLSLYPYRGNKTCKWLKPTKPFLSIPFTLVSTLDKSFVSDPSEIAGESIVVQIPIFAEYLQKLYPSLHVILQEDKSKMVEMLLASKVFAMAVLDTQADYIVDKYGYGKLKINGNLAKEKPVKISIGVQKEQETLRHIINKSLARISNDRMQNILNSWRLSRYQESIDYSLIPKTAGVMGVILLIMFYYQRKLKNFNKELAHQVEEKTKELRKINESLEVKVQQKAKELVQKDELLTQQSKQAVMGEMISMIAHQWRQPLNTITLQISNLQISAMMQEKLNKEEMMKTLDEISKTILYLSETVDDFKTYFRKDKTAVKMKVVEIIDKALGFIEPRLRANTIHVRKNIDKNLEVEVYLNELIQVLLNIFNNAVDAHLEQSADEEKERWISVDAKEENQEVVICIGDNAGGIAQENLGRLFEPYFSTKGKNGTGLGLYMSKMIIEKQFGGEIYAQSDAGHSTFVIKLPKSLHS